MEKGRYNTEGHGLACVVVMGLIGLNDLSHLFQLY